MSVLAIRCRRARFTFEDARLAATPFPNPTEPAAADGVAIATATRTHHITGAPDRQRGIVRVMCVPLLCGLAAPGLPVAEARVHLKHICTEIAIAAKVERQDRAAVGQPRTWVIQRKLDLHP